MFSIEGCILKEHICFDNLQSANHRKKMLYRVLVNVIIIRNLRRVEKVEEAFTLFGFSYWLRILSSLLWLLFQNLLCQVLSSNPLNIRPGFKKGISTSQNTCDRWYQKELTKNRCCPHEEAYPTARSKIGSSSSIMWYVLVSCQSQISPL